MILLFSGGVDSYVAYHYLNKPATVYFNLCSRYSERELKVVKQLIPATIIDSALNISDRETGAKAYVPFRNLLLACLAVKYSDTVYIIGLEDDVVSDKNEQVYKQFSELLSQLEQRPIQVLSPFWHMSKADIVKWYLEHTGNVDMLLKTISCYDSDEVTNYCGRCNSCFRKWVAFRCNGLPLKFKNIELVKEYWVKSFMQSGYTERRKNLMREIIVREFPDEVKEWQR